MPATRSQQPYRINASYTNLLYVANSVSSSQPQYQYVLDIYESGSAELLTRIKQYPNPADVAVFDTSRIMNDYLEYPTMFSLSGSSANGQTQIKKFIVSLGEEYGTSPSSSVTLYPNQSFTDITVCSAVVDPNGTGTIPFGLTGYDWPYATTNKIMSDRPSTIPIVGDQDFIYLSTYIGNETGTDSLFIEALNENGTVTDSVTYGVSPLGVDLNRFRTTNVGFNNTFFTADKALRVTLNGTETITFPYDTNACNYDRVNFCFINNYGFWDSYGVSLPIKKNTTINRREITKPFVDYSSITSPYYNRRRGKDLFNTYLTDNLSVTTQWLNQEEAEWLTQLIESPEVYVQRGDDMLPVIITNSNYTHNTNTRAQKKFQYEIQYQYANQRRGR